LQKLTNFLLCSFLSCYMRLSQMIGIGSDHISVESKYRGFTEGLRHNYVLLESRGSIISRPSLLDLGVRFSSHPAPDILNLRFCPCGCNRGMIHVLLQGCSAFDCCDYRLRGVDGLFHPLRILVRRLYMYGFVV
jgi:hypothetical protein